MIQKRINKRISINRLFPNLGNCTERKLLICTHINNNYAFTLIEVLISLALSAVILTAVQVVLRDFNAQFRALRTIDPAQQYFVALDIIAADARGITTIHQLQADKTTSAVPIACFTTTNRMLSIVSGRWAGLARVTYQLKSRQNAKTSLWRSETDLNQQSETSSTCLAENLYQFKIQLSGANDWDNWPRNNNQANNTSDIINPNMLKITAAIKEQDNEIKSLPSSILPIVAQVRLISGSKK